MRMKTCIDTSAKKRHGFTLIELLLTLTVLGVLLVVGMPGFRALIDSSAISGQVAMYSQALNTARYLAVSSRRGVTLCTLNDAGRCTGNWDTDLSLFYDDERDGILASERHIITLIGIPPGDTTKVRWRGFGENRFLHVRASGSYRQNGRFTFCPSPAGDGTATPGRTVIVNVLGRTRVEKYLCR